MHVCQDGVENRGTSQAYLKAFGNALCRRFAGQNFIVSREICYKCWRSEIEFLQITTKDLRFKFCTFLDEHNSA